MYSTKPSIPVLWKLEVNTSLIRASMWNPASVMNYQQYPIEARLGIKFSKSSSVIFYASQLNEGERLYDKRACGFY